MSSTSYQPAHFVASRIGAAVPERANVAYAPKSVGSEGTLSKITSVQRVNTAAGVAPKSGCSSATAGTQVRVDYTADYYFFAAR